MLNSILNSPEVNSQSIANAQNDTGSSVENGKEALDKGFEFLELLIAQLENQNPLEPMDTTELTNQLIQQAQLEQSIDTNENISSFLGEIEKTNKANNLNYIGTQAEIAGRDAPIQGGYSAWAYKVEGDAQNVTLTLTNEAGEIVYTADGSAAPGAQEVLFDATQADIPVREGEVLSLFVNATDKDGKKVNAATTSFAVVDGVDGLSGQNLLTAGNARFDSTDILRSGYISQASNQTPSNPDSTTD